MAAAVAAAPCCARSLLRGARLPVGLTRARRSLLGPRRPCRWPPPASRSAQALLDELRAGGVALVGGPRACAAFALPAAESLHVEYGDNTLCVEIVDSVDDAVTHIARWGSGHTEVIVTEDAEAAASFLAQVDSACVFHNASSRFADGFRFGLGCEVGISTSRIHARGPVGLEGLLTMRWRLVSAAGSGHTVGDFSAGVCQYIHESLQL